MRWQRFAQIAIALFVIAFIAVLAASMRRPVTSTDQATSATPLPDQKQPIQIWNPGGGKNEWFNAGRKVFDAQFGKHVGFADGRHLLSEGVRIMTNRKGKDLFIDAREVEMREKSGNFESANLKGKVTLTGEGGLEVRTEEATYVESEGIVRMPGSVAFKKGRLTGTSVGATYDLNREVLWLLDKGTFAVAAAADGTGAMSGSAATIGLARLEHYVRLTKDAQINGEGRDIRGNEMIITLTPDDERVQKLEIRGKSRITGGQSGPQGMSAQDIDVTYGADGRSIQNANLMEQAVLQLAPSTLREPQGRPEQGRGATGSGQAGGGGKQISGRTINLGMAPDGKTLTNLNANENVQVDLPPENNGPAKRIRSAALVATGTPEAGLTTASFTGKVDYRETRAARRNLAAIDRHATSESLQIETKPGLGAVDKADFRGNVEFKDADVTAKAPRGVYHVERDRIELMPSDGDPGLPPTIEDAKISVGARTIEFTLSTRDLSADTKVRSTLKQKAGGKQQAKVPSVLKQDEPINVTANKLRYQGSASKAVYSGNVVMWQEKDSGTIKGDTLTLDDKTGNLEVDGNVVTNFTLQETDKETGQKKQTPTTGRAKTFVFDDKRRLGTYTGNAQLDGPQGNLTAHKIEIFLKPNENEVERLEAYAQDQGSDVVIREGKRRSYGRHLTYTAANDEYLMVGTPVESIEEEEERKGYCRVSYSNSITFQKGQQTGVMRGSDRTPAESKSVLCSSLKR